MVKRKLLLLGLLILVTPAWGLERSDLICGIISHAEGVQVAAFGENHVFREDNDFFVDLLPHLRGEGFEYLALEIDRNPPASTPFGIFQSYTRGTSEWSRDVLKAAWDQQWPGMIEIADRANEVGMDIVFYDADEDHYARCDWSGRERIAYHNLRELIFERDPAARVVIFCGARHLNDKPVKNLCSLEVIDQEIPYLGFYLRNEFKENCVTFSLLNMQSTLHMAFTANYWIDLVGNKVEPIHSLSFDTRPVQLTKALPKTASADSGGPPDEQKDPE